MDLIAEAAGLLLLVAGATVANSILPRLVPGISRLWKRSRPDGRAECVFRAYIALGLFLALMFAFAAGLLSFAFSIYFADELFVFAAAWLVVASIALAWAFHAFLSLVPIWLELSEAAMITHFSLASRGSVRFVPWREVKMARVWGAWYAVGGKRWFPLGWMLVRDADRFHADLTRLLTLHGNA